MNKIYMGKKYELLPGKFVIPFSCYQLMGIDTEKAFIDRTAHEQEVIKNVRDRIRKALLKHDFVLENINFRSMSITAIKTKVLTGVING